MASENLGTIWVCLNCMLHEANGECGSRHDDEYGHDREPLSAIEAPYSVTLGMSVEAHHEECAVRITGEASDNEECDCDRDTFSTSQCEGCGSYLRGERHAMTLWKN